MTTSTSIADGPQSAFLSALEGGKKTIPGIGVAIVLSEDGRERQNGRVAHGVRIYLECSPLFGQ